MGSISCGDRCLSSEQLNLRAARVASGFAEFGVGVGDVVALLLRNDICLFEAQIAVGLLGAYSTPINWHCSAPEAEYIFKDAKPRAIVAHADLLAGIQAVLPPGIPVIVVPTPPEIAAAYGLTPQQCAVPPGMQEWSAWVEQKEAFAGPIQPSPGTMVYTSGTTGHPKGVRRARPTPEQAAASMAGSATTVGLHGYESDPGAVITAITGPLYHSAPNAFAMAAVRFGATVILMPRFDAEGLLALIEKERVTHLNMVPIMFARMLRLPEEVRAKYDLSSLKFVSHGAAPCPMEVKQAMLDWLGPIVHEYYGSTETSVLTFCTAADWLTHRGSIGLPLAGTTVRIVDAHREELPVGQIGEIIARNSAIPEFEYHNDTGKRQAADVNGLIATGDIGYVDQDGFVYICDRAKDMIISGGANIYPAEIEGELQHMPGVADCCVFGIPDDEFGESIHAVIQRQAGAALDEVAVKTYLRGRMAGFKVPKSVAFANTLPREDTGKIFKRKLRAPFWEGRAAAI